jgi:hypothetical protein
LGTVKTFKFTLLYLPTDCVIGLKVKSATAKAVVSDWGAKGVKFVGVWASSTEYETDDLATLDGAAWRAKRPNVGAWLAEEAL